LPHPRPDNKHTTCYQNISLSPQRCLYPTLKYPKYYLSKIFLCKLIPLKLIGPSKVRVTSGANLGRPLF
jgi:hypothetical protein